MKIREEYNTELSRNDSYRNVIGRLSGQRKLVYDCIVSNSPISDNRISELTGIRVHIVVARRNELWGKEKNPHSNRYEINKKLQVIEFAGYDETSSPRQSLWKPVVPEFQPSLF